MQKTQIDADCVLDSVIVDKDVKITVGTRVVGEADSPYVIPKGATQGALMNS